MKNDDKNESAEMLSTHFVAFLKSRPLISIRRLEVSLKMPNDTLKKALQGRRDIPQKYFYDLSKILRDYGFDWPEVEFYGEIPFQIMQKITFVEKINGSGEPVKHGKTITIDSSKLIGHSTKSLYIRNGKFLSQRGNGSTGAGDVCNLTEVQSIEVGANLFARIVELAKKANAIT